MSKSEKGAAFVASSLGISLVGAVCSAVRWAGPRAITLLVATAFLTAMMVLVAAWTAYRTWRIHRSLMQASLSPVPVLLGRQGVWHWLTRRQWIILTFGLTAITALTGGLAGVEVLHQPRPTSNFAQPAPATTIPTVTANPPTVPAAVPPPASEPTTTPTPSADHSSSPTDSPDPGSSTPRPGATTYLDVTDPVNGGSYHDAGAITFSGKRYPRSLKMGCQSATSNYLEWNVAGYQTFSATFGIPDSVSDAFGAVAELIAYDQDGHELTKPIDVSLGHSQQVTIPLTGVVHLRLTCSGRDTKTNRERYFYSGLGDPLIVS
jgi:hypothetical protein